MLVDQHQLVRFSIKPRHVERITHSQRLMSRFQVRCSQRPPLSLWAGWVLERILSCHSFLKNIFIYWFFSEEARGRKSSINLLFHLLMVVSWICPDRRWNPQPWLPGGSSNQLSDPTRALYHSFLSHGFTVFCLIICLMTVSRLIICLWLFFPLSKNHFLLILTVSILVPIISPAWVRKNTTMHVSLRENRSCLHKLHHLPHLFEYNCADGWNRWELTLNERGSRWESFFL